MKKVVRQWLESFPRFYLRVLRLLNRGSIEKRVFLAVLQPGDVVFDVGANRGDFTLLFSKVVGPHGQVHAFEPVASTFAILEEAVGPCANVTINNCALGDAEGAVLLYLPGDDDGQASLRAHSGGSWTKSVSVSEHECRVTTLDKYAAEMTRIDFLKCDVEGAERLVLSGSADSLRSLSPLLFIEVDPKWMRTFGYNTADIVSDLRLLGYDTFQMVTNKVGAPSAQWSEVSGNMIASKRSIHGARLASLSFA